MLKLTLLLAASFVAVSPAAAESFVHEGVTYSYSVSAHKNTKVISGSDDHGNRFVLRVGATRVVGDVAGRPVSFWLRDVVSAKRTDDRIAMR